MISDEDLGGPLDYAPPHRLAGPLGELWYYYQSKYKYRSNREEVGDELLRLFRRLDDLLIGGAKWQQ